MSDIDELKKLAEAAGFEVSSEITWEGVICTEEVAELVSLVRAEQADAIERLQRELAEARKANEAELYQLRSQNEALLGVYDAAVNLEKVKGRFHTEQAFQLLIKSLDAARQQEG